jgi:hypothetical protein
LTALAGTGRPGVIAQRGSRLSAPRAENFARTRSIPGLRTSTTVQGESGSLETQPSPSAIVQ